MTAADRDREAFEACQYAERLAASMHAKHYSDNTTWRPLSGDLIGLLTQIYNMAAGLTHARAQAGEPVAAGAWTREDLAAGLAELDGIDLVPPLKSVVDLEYLNRADDLLTFLSVASAANEPLGAIHPAPAQEPVAVPAAVKRCLGFFASVIKSGEPWTATCQREYDAAISALAAAPVSPPAKQKVFPQDFAPAGGWPRRPGAGDIAMLKDGRIGKIEDVGACTYGLRMTDGEFITVHHEAVSPPAESGAREKLSETIKTRLLGVEPDEQDVVLEDNDWRMILAALSPSPSGWDAGAEAMREACAKEVEDCARAFPDLMLFGVGDDIADNIRALPLPTPPAGEG